MAIVGLIGALLMFAFGSMFGSMLGGMASEGMDGAGIAAGFGAMAIIIFPLIYGAMGFVMGLIGAALYNLVAKMIGGIKIQLDDV